jgi:hypothetical protein
MNKMKEAAVKHKNVELLQSHEIAQLHKESQKRENTIHSLKAEKQTIEAVLKRKQEEVTALSNKATGRVVPRHGKFWTIYYYLFKIFLSLWILAIYGSFYHCYMTYHIILNALSDHHVVLGSKK